MSITLNKYTTAIVLLAAIGGLSSCSHHVKKDTAGMGSAQATVQKTASHQSMQTKKAMSSHNKQSNLVDSLYIVQVGDYTTIKAPSKYFFTQNTSNLVPSFYSNIQSLADVVSQYKPSMIKVHAIFPVSEKTERFDAIANNQADIFVAK